jgi:hypothetical protein
LVSLTGQPPAGLSVPQQLCALFTVLERLGPQEPALSRTAKRALVLEDALIARVLCVSSTPPMAMAVRGVSLMQAPKSKLTVKVGWFAAYWLASVTALSVVAHAIRWAIS